MAAGQKLRKSKTSKGTHGAGGKGRSLTSIEKINMGGGALRQVKTRWAKPA